MWQVILTKQPLRDAWGSTYFPRKVYYKKDAKKIVENVEFHGGEAKIEKVPG